jgi:peptide/nickel transport system ATP-binding protein
LLLRGGFSKPDMLKCVPIRCRVELGHNRQIFAAARHPYTQALLSAEPGAARARIILKGDIPSPIDRPTGCHFHTRRLHAFERCRQEEPALRPMADGSLVACHLHGQQSV